MDPSVTVLDLGSTLASWPDGDLVCHTPQPTPPFDDDEDDEDDDAGRGSGGGNIDPDDDEGWSDEDDDGDDTLWSAAEQVPGRAPLR